MDELLNIIGKTFDMHPEEINLSQTPNEIDPWDSLGQLLLVNTIEDHYDISLEIEEIFRIMSLNDIYEILKERGKIE